CDSLSLCLRLPLCWPLQPPSLSATLRPTLLVRPNGSDRTLTRMGSPRPHGSETTLTRMGSTHHRGSDKTLIRMAGTTLTRMALTMPRGRGTRTRTPLPHLTGRGRTLRQTVSTRLPDHPQYPVYSGATRLRFPPQPLAHVSSGLFLLSISCQSVLFIHWPRLACRTVFY
ncbi:unnamed protein product, partial [Rhizoctonia solani]